MPRASQRHKLETQELAGSSFALGALTFTFTGVFAVGLLVIATVRGDVSGDISATIRLDDNMTEAELATAVAAALDALTGVSASSLLGVVTIVTEAPNASVVAQNVEFAGN